MSQKNLSEFESSGVECDVCGRVFDTEAGKNRHKGAKHESTKVDVECRYCGSEFSVYPSQEDRSQFCDTVCKEKWESENWKGENAPAWQGRTVERECDWCSETYTADKCDLEKGEARYCSRECFNAWQRTIVGPEHPLWRGGKGLTDSLRKSLGGWYTAKEAAQKDECEWCGAEDSGSGKKAFDVHHIIPLNAGGTNHQENLICLCRTCHGKMEAYTRDIPEVEPITELVD